MMQNKIFQSMDAAVADIPDGSSIFVAGFGPGTPYNLIVALHRQGAKDLTIITNGVGRRDEDHSVLVKSRRVKKLVASFTATPYSAHTSPFAQLYEKGEIDGELIPQGTLAERIRAGGAGIPAFFTPTGAGTEIASGREQRMIKGRLCVLEEALTADYAFIRAWKADTFGNLLFQKAQRNFNPIMAMAARTTIVEVEEPIVEAGAFDPDHVHTSGIFVHRLVHIPPPPKGILDPAYNL